ncbi:hypothetical protein ElyMa_005152300 [Elysia marginata]|uniref:VWFD domain-containing protein n=1 Tax=Elysia marginata TaxID=1093978 RepID=A0AAV4JS55_9GAST|nr:hypothetical protein ElyMa_005152300 [Elysia marginata]
MALSYLKEKLKPCNTRLRFLLATLIRQAEMKQRMVCTPPTCNIPYASTCALDVEMKMKKFMEIHGHVMQGDAKNGSMMGGMGKPKNGTDSPSLNNTGNPMRMKLEKFCRDVKVAMACVANHTITCNKEKYGSVNMRMKNIGKHFRRVCGNVITLPPEKCIPPPPMPVGGRKKGTTNERMPMPSILYVIKNMAKFSLFDDDFLCQTILSIPEARRDSMLTDQFCGLKEKQNDLFCLEGTYANGSFIHLGIDKCKGTGNYCVWKYDNVSDTETMGCAMPTECKVPETPDGNQRCCKDNLCNIRAPTKRPAPCKCDTRAAVRLVNSTTMLSNQTAQQCSRIYSTINEKINGCPDYPRHMLVAMPAFSKNDVFLYSSHNPETSHYFTKCVAIVTRGCSKSRILKAQHSRLVEAKNNCKLDEKRALLKNATSSSNQMVSSGYKAAKVILYCGDKWLSAEAKANRTWDENILGLNECLKLSNISKSPMSMNVKKFQNLVSALAVGIVKLKSEMKFDRNCFDNISIENIISSHSSDVYTGNLGLCKMHRIKQANCSHEMKHLVLSAVMPDCILTWASFNKTCYVSYVQSCFKGFLKAPVKSWDKFSGCLNSTTAMCDDDIAKIVRMIAHKVLVNSSMDYMKPGSNDSSNRPGRNHSNNMPGDGGSDYRPGDRGDMGKKDDDRKEPKDKAYMMPMPYSKESVEKYYGNSTCVCDPALAVHCIFEVNHLSKQDDPDWENLCPLVNKSGMCAHRFVQGCNECQKKTVKEIVTKLSYGLKKTCEAPPESECKSLKAMDCVTDLMEYHTANKQSDNITTCVEISKTKKCIEANLKGCEKTTELKINRLLNQVIERWDGLQCETPRERLGTCRDLFESDVNVILSFDMNAMFSNMEINDTKQWEEFQEYCEDMRTAWKCVDETLELDRDRKGSNIIKDSLKGIYLSVKKICTPVAATYVAS